MWLNRHNPGWGEKKDVYCIYRNRPLQVNSASLLCLRRLFLTHLIDIDMIHRPWRPQDKTASELPPHLHYTCRLQLHVTAISPATHRSCAHAACTWNAQIHPSRYTVFKSQRINWKFNTCTSFSGFLKSCLSSQSHRLATSWHLFNDATKTGDETGPPSFWSIKIIIFGGNQSYWPHWKLLNNKRLEISPSLLCLME